MFFLKKKALAVSNSIKHEEMAIEQQADAFNRNRCKADITFVGSTLEDTLRNIIE